MEYAADDINYGYMSIIMHINSEYTLIDKIENIREIDGTIEHPIFGKTKGGVSFSLFLRGFYTVFEAVLNYGDRFDVYVVNEQGNTVMMDDDLDHLISLRPNQKQLPKHLPLRKPQLPWSQFLQWHLLQSLLYL